MESLKNVCHLQEFMHTTRKGFEVTSSSTIVNEASKINRGRESLVLCQALFIGSLKSISNWRKWWSKPLIRFQSLFDDLKGKENLWTPVEKESDYVMRIRHFSSCPVSPNFHREDLAILSWAFISRIEKGWNYYKYWLTQMKTRRRSLIERTWEKDA